MIVGLGNPGAQYVGTRHNFGYEIIDWLAGKLAADQNWRLDGKFQAQVLVFDYSGERVILVKPVAFYNLTGQVARRVADYYHIATADILAIHDEMALPLGTVRSRLGGSDAGNNGIKSLNQYCGEGYYRLRVGAQPVEPTMASRHNLVLGRLNAADRAAFDRVVPRVGELAKQFIVGGLTQSTYRLLADD